MQDLFIFGYPADQLLQALLSLAGRLHPASVHFPIALILLAAALEIIHTVSGRKFKQKSPSRTSIILVGFGGFGVLVALVLGLLLANEQQFFGNLKALLILHRNLGFVLFFLTTTTFVWGFLALRTPKPSRILIYRLLLLSAALTVCWGGHLGGLLVHGEGYYQEAFQGLQDKSDTLLADLDPLPSHRDDLRASLRPDALLASHTAETSNTKEVFNILHTQCGRCHASGKRKGKFAMDTREDFLRGGENGPAIVPGESEKSLLVKLIRGDNPKTVMPNKGRRLNSEEIKAISEWIDAGAPWDEPGQIDYPKASHKLPATIDKEKIVGSPIDYFVNRYLEAEGALRPSNLVTDELYIRRVYLDLLGLLPTSREIRSGSEFLKAHRMKEFVQSVLAERREFALHWLTFWNDLLRNDYTGPGFVNKSRRKITPWLLESLISNKPLDKFTRDLIAPNRESSGFVKGITWPGKIAPDQVPAMQAAQGIGQVFLGLNLKCASCHDSFTDYLTLKDSYGMASVYSNEPLEIHECNFPTGKIAEPSFVIPELGSIGTGLSSKEKQKQLAKLVTHPENGRFARTLVNRVWAKLFGQGIINPVDDLDAPPFSQELLDYLAADFIEHNYDMNHLLTEILASETYRFPSHSSEQDLTPSTKAKFRSPRRRLLTAEQFVDISERFLGTLIELRPSDVLRSFALLEPFGAKSLKAFRGSESEPVSAQIELTTGERTLSLTSIPEHKKKGQEVKIAPVTWKDITLHFSDGTKKLLALSDLAFYYSEGEELTEQVSTDSNNWTTAPFSVLTFRLPAPQRGKTVSSLSFSVLPTGGGNSLNYNVYSDLSLRASLRERTPLMTALGRPERTQFASSRDSQATTTMRALELATDDVILTAIKNSKLQLGKFGEQSPHHLMKTVQSTFLGVLGRSPNQEEERVLEELLPELGDRANQEDLLWSLLNTPDFQWIM